MTVEENTPVIIIRFSCVGRMREDYTVWCHVVRENGEELGHDRMPDAPTTAWVPGRSYTHSIRLDVPPGWYTVRWGVYLMRTGARLGIDGTDGDCIEIWPRCIDCYAKPN